MNKDEAKQELSHAIQVWQRGGNYEVELDNGKTIDLEAMECYLNGAGWNVEDIPEEKIDEIASDYIDLFSLELFRNL